MPSVKTDRTTIEKLIEITLGLVLLWTALEQAKQMRGATNGGPSSFWYYSARYTNKAVVLMRKLEAYSLNNYYNSI